MPKRCWLQPVEGKEAWMRTFGQDLPAFLAAHGIMHAFGIPGVHTVELYRGLPGSGITHVTPRHEQGAGSWPTAMGLPPGGLQLAS